MIRVEIQLGPVRNIEIHEENEREACQAVENTMRREWAAAKEMKVFVKADDDATRDRVRDYLAGVAAELTAETHHIPEARP